MSPSILLCLKSFHLQRLPSLSKAKLSSAKLSYAKLSYATPRYYFVYLVTIALFLSLSVLSFFSVLFSFATTNFQAYFFEEALLEDRALPKSEKEETFKTFFSEMIRDIVQTP